MRLRSLLWLVAVIFIRHLNEFAPAQLKEMQKLNPKTPAEIEEERQDEEFLRGGTPPAATKPQAPTHIHHH